MINCKEIKSSSMGGFISKIGDFTDVGNDDDELIKVGDSFHHVEVGDKGVERTLTASSRKMALSSGSCSGPRP